MYATRHRLAIADARALDWVDTESVDLVVTSPPYPMIAMWDEVFGRMNPSISRALKGGDGRGAFELMHAELDACWAHVYRVLKPGGFACINIGDATRTLEDRFALYTNHSRIIQGCTAPGFTALPVVLWRKPTNAPNKFMGSGMLPAGAYVTLEHEYVLVFRKKGKRSFRDDSSRRLRRQSAFFWEERNNWFSDVWTIRPVGQVLAGSLHRERSGAFPLELAARLINMYSLQQDTILDPFAGTGTTMLASLGCGRNSIGVELDEGFRDSIEQAITTSGPELNALVQKRLSSHRAFVERHEREKGPIRYRNTVYDFPVVTRQETDLAFPYLAGVRPAGDGEFVAAHELGEPQPELRLQ